MTPCRISDEAVKAARGAGFVADQRGDSDLVCAEEVLERVHGIAPGVRCVTRWVSGKGGVKSGGGWHTGVEWVEQRQPRRVGLSIRVAVGVGLADCGDCSPELPVIFVVPTANGGISSGEVLHRKQARAVNDVQLLADGQRAKDPVKQGVSVILPKDRSIRLVRRASCARERSDLLDLVKVFRVYASLVSAFGPSVRSIAAPRHDKRSHVPDPRRGVVREVSAVSAARRPALAGTASAEARSVRRSAAR